MRRGASTNGATPIVSASAPVMGVGAASTAAWLRERKQSPPDLTRWHVEIAIGTGDVAPTSEFDENTATRLHLDLYQEEWGIYFCHEGKSSWIRVTDIAFVHGRDEYQLLGLVPPLRDVGMLVRRLETTHGLRFAREHATIATNLEGAEPSIRAWLAAL